MSTKETNKLTAGYEKETINKAIEKIYAVYSSGAGESLGGNEYQCTRVLNRLYWYRRKTIRCKLGYHILSTLIVIMPLTVTAIKAIIHTPLQPSDYVEIILTSLTSVFAFILGHFRFLEKWKRYRKILEKAIHICSYRLIDNSQITYEATVHLLIELENLFKEDTIDWTPDPKGKKE